MNRLMKRTMADFAARPGANLMAMLAITLVTFLAGLCLLVLSNVQSQLARGADRLNFVIYAKADASTATIAEQWKAIRGLDGFAELTTYSPAQALAELGAGLSTDLAWLAQDNPLPATAVASFTVPPGQPEAPGRIRSNLAALPGVERVAASPLQMESARNWAAMGSSMAWGLVALLALTAALISAHTIRTALCARDAEVEILHLVGATEAYIRLPLVLGATLQGLAGGLVALGLLRLLQWAAATALSEATAMALTVDFLSPAHALGLLGLMTLSCAGAGLATMRP